jgi:hypothetical protein
MNMKRTYLSGAVVAVAVSAQAAIAGVEQIKEIDVTADLTAIQNADAAAYWGTLETDLEAAIATLVTDRLAEEGGDGAQILVDLREVELASAFDRAINLGDALLVGQVNIVDDTDNSNFDAYELSVSLENAMVIVPEGQTVVFNADDADAYRALVDTFAKGVVDRLK